jgi:hypothetical protein
MFTNSLALIALSLLALPIIIHALVRFSGRKTLFPTLRFLRQTESQRLRLIEIKRWPLLVLRLLAMALLVLAIAGPTLMKATRSRAVLVLIDSSLSMNAAAMKEQATSRAREAISSLSAADSAAVAQFDGSAKLLQDFTNDRVALENAIASYSPRFQAADFGAALMWANEKLAAQPGSRELFFISDLQSSNLYQLEPTRLSDVDLKVIRINNERRANARIDSIAVQAAGETLEVNSTALFDDAERTTLEPINLKFNRSGANNSASNALFSATMLGDDLLAGAVRTNRADDFDADDVRFFVARLAGAEKVMIVQPRFASTDQATFIEKAIQANSPAAVIQRQDALPDNADSFERVHTIIAPIEALSKNNIAAARERVRKGISLILTVGAETDASSAIEKLKELDGNFASLALDSIVPNDVLSLRQPARSVSDVPLFDSDTASAFASVRFHAAVAVHLSEGETLLKYSNGEPAAVRVRAGGGRVVLLGFGLSGKDSTLVSSPIFPAFVEWLTQSDESNQGKANFIIGQTPASFLLKDLTEMKRVYSANSQAQDEPISDYRNALEQPGVYSGQYTSGKIVFALNAPVVESSLAQSSEQEFLQRVAIDKAESSNTNSNKEKTGLWMTIAICALAVSLIELVYSQLKRAH